MITNILKLLLFKKSLISSFLVVTLGAALRARHRKKSSHISHGIKMHRKCYADKSTAVFTATVEEAFVDSHFNLFEGSFNHAIKRIVGDYDGDAGNIGYDPVKPP